MLLNRINIHIANNIPKYIINKSVSSNFHMFIFLIYLIFNLDKEMALTDLYCYLIRF